MLKHNLHESLNGLSEKPLPQFLHGYRVHVVEVLVLAAHRPGEAVRLGAAAAVDRN